MTICVLCKKEVHTVGAIHLVDDQNKVVCDNNPADRPVHKLKND